MRRRVWTKVTWERGPNGELVLDEANSSWEWYDGPVALAHGTYSLSQDHWRFYEPGTESGSVAIAAEDTNITRQTGTGNAFQVRILLQETGDANGGTETYELRYSKNAGAYNLVTASSNDVRAVNDPSLTDDEVTTSRLAGGAGTFVAGRVDDVDGATTTGVQVRSLDNTEMLFSVYIVDADVADLDTLDFRAYITGGTAVEAYAGTGRVTVDKTAAPTPQAVVATSAPTAVNSTLASFLRSLSAVSAPVATLAKLVSKLLESTAIGVAEVATQATRLQSIAATALGVAVVAAQRKAQELIEAVAVGVAEVAAQVRHLRSISASAAAVAVVETIARFLRSLSAVAVGVAEVVKELGTQNFPQAIDAVATAVASVATSARRLVEVVASAVGVAAVATVKRFVRTLEAVATAVAAVGVVVEKFLDAVVTAVATLQKQAGKFLQGIAVGSAALQKRVGKLLQAVAAGVALVGRTVPAIQQLIEAVASGTALLRTPNFLKYLRAVAAVGAELPAGPAAYFDGNIRGSRGSALTGAANGKLGIYSIWVRRTPEGEDLSNPEVIATDQLVKALTAFATNGSSPFRWFLRNAANVTLKDFRSVKVISSADNWVHVLASWDLANDTFHVYVNDEESFDPGPVSTTDDNIDYAGATNFFLGHSGLGGSKIRMASFYWNQAEYLDFSVEANRRKFILADGTGADLGSDGSTPTGSAPIIFLDNPYPEWGKNLGTGGDLDTGHAGSSGTPLDGSFVLVEVQKFISKLIQAIATGAASFIIPAAQKTIAAIAAGTAVVTRALDVSFSVAAIAVGSATVALLRQVFQMITAVGTGVATNAFAIVKYLRAAATAIADLGEGVGKFLQATVLGVASSVRARAISIEASAVGVAVALFARVKVISASALAIASRGAIQLGKKVKATAIVQACYTFTGFRSKASQSPTAFEEKDE